MARPGRLKLKDEEGFFHIMSRTVGQEFYLEGKGSGILFKRMDFFSGSPVGSVVCVKLSE